MLFFVGGLLSRKAGGTGRGSSEGAGGVGGRVVLATTACGTWHRAGCQSLSKHSPNTWGTREVLDKAFELEEFKDK